MRRRLYPIGGRNCRKMRIQDRKQLEKKLSLMATGTLLGVKILRRYAEHVVTLDAHTVKHRLPGRRGFMFRVMRLGLSGFVCHRQILAYWWSR